MEAARSAVENNLASAFTTVLEEEEVNELSLNGTPLETVFSHPLKRSISPRTLAASIAVAENEKYKAPLGVFQGIGEDDRFTLYKNPEDVAKTAYVSKQAELADLFRQKQASGQPLTQYEASVIQDHSHFRQGELTQVAQTGVRGIAIGATLLAPEAIVAIWGVAEGINGALDGLNSCHYDPNGGQDYAKIGVHTAMGASITKGTGAMIGSGIGGATYGSLTDDPHLMSKGLFQITVGGAIKIIPKVIGLKSATFSMSTGVTAETSASVAPGVSKLSQINTDALNRVGADIERTNQSYLIDASNMKAKLALGKKLRQLEKAQNNSVKETVLPDGRVRYYEAERLASNPGNTRGNSRVVEYNPETGQVRSWMESYDHSSNVNRVHPKNIDGREVFSSHYPLTAKEKGLP